MNINDFADSVIARAKKPVDREKLLERLEKAEAKKDRKKAKLAKEKEEKKAKRAAFEQEVKEGLKFMEDKMEGVSTTMCSVAGYTIGIGAYDILGEGKRFATAACFCSPADKWSNRVANGLLGKRIAYTPTIYEYKEETDPQVALRAALFDLLSKCHTDEGKKIPERIRRACHDGGGIALVQNG